MAISYGLTSISSARPLVALLVAGTIIIYFLNIRYGRPGLRSIPGPFWASITNWDRIRSCASGKQMNYHLQLHAKYGPLVRIGPNHVSFSDPKHIPMVYGINTKFRKSNFYSMFDIQTSTGTTSMIFSVRDENEHQQIRRPVANAYSLSTMKELEPMNDAVSAVFMEKLEKYVGQEIDLGKFVHWYAFDVITSITFSNTLGMLAQERDISNIIAAIEGRLIYNSIVGQVPWMHKYLFGNAYVCAIANLIPQIRILNSSKYIVDFAAQQLKRYEEQEFNTVPLKDMLDRFKRFKDEEQLIDESRMLSHATSNIFAGADTTAASLRAIFYYLCRTPSAHAKLLAEIDEAEERGQLSESVTFAEAQSLPYLQAVIKEALRMHPAVGMLLEKVVPEGGADFGEVHLPWGTVVGMNPWLPARDAAVYPEPYTFRPERWLDASSEQLKLMERNFLAFGSGSRTCIGRNISMLEMSKLVPQILRKYEFELMGQWEVWDYWFVKQTGLKVKVVRRK